MRSGVTAQRAASADTHWELWSTFCHELALDSLLSNLQDPVALLQVFAHQSPTDTIAPKRKPVHSRTMADALRSVAQAFAGLGQPNPYLAMKCFNTFASKPNLPCEAALPACSNLDPSFSFHITMSHVFFKDFPPSVFFPIMFPCSMVSMLATPPYPIHDGFPSSVERLEALPPA